MPITDSGACRSLFPNDGDQLKGTTLDNPKDMGHALPRKGGSDVPRKVIHAKNRRSSEIEV
jgi:hypothetical protein